MTPLMLAGRPPFSGDTALAVAVKHLNEAPPSLKELRPDVPSGVVALNVEIADTPARQAVGLMYRTALPERYGMLFTNNPPREASMWMRNTYVPLDMVFIRADGTVHRIAEMTEPHSEEIISSNGPVGAVLEIAGGSARKLGLKPGDKVRHRHFGTMPAP